MARLMAPLTAAAPDAPRCRRARRDRAARLAALCLAATLAIAMPSPARGQNLPFDPTAATITTTAPIANYIDTQVAAMASGDREKVVAARVQLLAPLSDRVQNKSAAFLNAYAREFAQRMMPIATGKDPHAKLNLAIVAIRAGETSRSAALSPLIAALEADPSDAIATFGLRAAGTVVIYALGNAATAGADPMVPAAIKAVQTHADSDMVAFESYRALTGTLNDNAAAAAVGPQVVQAATPRLIDAVHELMEVRLGQFAGGDIIEPAAESPGFTFLTLRAFDTSTPAQRARTVDLISRVLDAASTHLTTIAAAGAAQNRQRQTALRNMIKAAAQGMGVIGDKTSSKPISAAALTIKNYGDATPAAEYRSAAEKLVEEARKSFPGAQPATAPATRPAGQ